MQFHFARCSFLLAAVLIAPALTVSAQVAKPSTNYVLKVTPDRAAALYQSGEMATFKLELTLDKLPVPEAEVQWTLTKDGMPPATSGKAKLVNGAATVTGKLDEPGFLLCRATFAGPEKKAYTGFGGAGIEPLKINPSLPVPADFDAFWASGDLRDYRTRGRESRETIYFRGMFLRLVRAIDFLTAQPEWDGKTVVVFGSSQGGFQAIVAAGLDARVTFLAAGVPAGCDHTGITAGRINGWPKFIPSPSAEKADVKVVEAVRYYDAMNFATRTKAGAVFTVGFIDLTCPPTSVYAAYNNLGGKKSIHNDPSAGHTNTPKASEAMRLDVLEHVKAQGAK